MKATAIFLDRDGTLIPDRNYISDPDEVELLAGSAEAVRRFCDAGYLVVLASNQSGIARGLFDEEALDDVHARLQDLLADEGVALDGAYYCPYLDGPEATVEAYRRDSELRKPKPGMLLQAARELNIDLKRSWMIGDSPTDALAGARSGCRTILLDNGHGNLDDLDVKVTHTAANLAEAADLILGKSKPMPAPKQTANVDRATGVKRALGSKRASPQTTRNDNDDVVPMLHKIHDLLEREHRRGRQDDFSLMRLLAALLQMFAVVAAVWGGSALLGDQTGIATARLTLACFLQIVSISAFAVDRFR